VRIRCELAVESISAEFSWKKGHSRSSRAYFLAGKALAACPAGPLAAARGGKSASKAEAEAENRPAALQIVQSVKTWGGLPPMHAMKEGPYYCHLSFPPTGVAEP
jgi:hypothetical protein